MPTMLHVQDFPTLVAMVLETKIESMHALNSYYPTRLRLYSPVAYLRPLYIHPWPQATARIPHSFLLPASWEKIVHTGDIHSQSCNDKSSYYILESL